MIWWGFFKWDWNCLTLITILTSSWSLVFGARGFAWGDLMGWRMSTSNFIPGFFKTLGLISFLPYLNLISFGYLTLPLLSYIQIIRCSLEDLRSSAKASAIHTQLKSSFLFTKWNVWPMEDGFLWASSQGGISFLLIPHTTKTERIRLLELEVVLDVLRLSTRTTSLIGLPTIRWANPFPSRIMTQLDSVRRRGKYLNFLSILYHVD